MTTELELEIAPFHKACQRRVQQLIDKLLPKADDIAPQVHQAMMYSMANGGKRLRPTLVYAAGDALGIKAARLDAAAMAIELIHCYSMIHDDLPAMDNDDVRRGKPSCHIQFNEATAILAGDALLTLAFEILSSRELNPNNPEQALQMCHSLSQAAGGQGMVLGQDLDLSSEGKRLTLEKLQTLHQHKTGALIQACVNLPLCLAEDLPSHQRDSLKEFAQLIGLGYQIMDDILDVTGSSDVIGKLTGQDSKHNKATFVSLMGLENAKKFVMDIQDRANACLSFLQQKKILLSQLSIIMVNREA